MTYALMYAVVAIVIILVEDRAGPQTSPKWVPILMGVLWPLHIVLFVGFFVAAMRQK